MQRASGIAGIVACFVLGAVCLAVVLSGCGSTTLNSAHPPGWGLPVAPRTVRLAANPSTTATMYDSVTLGTIPRNPFALAGYTSGYWPTYWAMRTNYPRVHVVSIAVNSSHNANCLDVEPGDARPSEVPGWVRRQHTSRACVYSSYWEFVNEIRPILNRAGISRASVWEWSADYTYVPHIDAGFDGTQYTDHALGRNLDASIVKLGFLTIAHPPYIIPSPRPPAPNSHAVRIALLRSYAKRRGCYIKHHRHPRACKVWGAEVRALQRS